MYNEKEMYGIEPMDINEAFEYFKTNPYSAKTRNNKVRLVTAFEKIRKTAEYMKEYSKTIPVEENEYHSNKVNELTEAMERFERQMGEELNRIIYGN